SYAFHRQFGPSRRLFNLIVRKTVVGLQSGSSEQCSFILYGHKLICVNLLLSSIPKYLLRLKTLVFDQIFDLNIAFTPVEVFIFDKISLISYHCGLQLSVFGKKLYLNPLRELLVSIEKLELYSRPNLCADYSRITMNQMDILG